MNPEDWIESHRYQLTEFSSNGKIVRLMGVGTGVTVIVYEKALDGWTPSGIGLEELLSLFRWHQEIHKETERSPE